VSTGAKRSGDGDQTALASVAAPVRIFINYRRVDAGSAALLLHYRLAERFSAENVFFDSKQLGAGMKWLEKIKAAGQQSNIFLAVIGPQWLNILTKRHAAEVLDQVTDYASLEIEFALSKWRAHIIPVLVDGAEMPKSVNLPQNIRGLGARHDLPLRSDCYDDDFEKLVVKITERPGRRRSGAGCGAAGRRAIRRVPGLAV
jgi:hypothetical protein